MKSLLSKKVLCGLILLLVAGFFANLFGQITNDASMPSEGERRDVSISLKEMLDMITQRVKKLESVDLHQMARADTIDNDLFDVLSESKREVMVAADAFDDALKAIRSHSFRKEEKMDEDEEEAKEWSTEDIKESFKVVMRSYSKFVRDAPGWMKEQKKLEEVPRIDPIHRILRI